MPGTDVCGYGYEWALHVEDFDRFTRGVNRSARDAASDRIDWEKLDKTKFLSLCTFSAFSIRFCIYPVQLIKTRLQIQRRDDMYAGFWDAAAKTYKNERLRGLYKGFWINSMQIPAGVFYVTANEGCRYLLSHYEASPSVKSLVAGGVASFAVQTVVVPLDVVTQHLAVAGLQGHRGKDERALFDSPSLHKGSRQTTALDVIRFLYKSDGPKGLYRGYWITVVTQVPYSALWWTLYQSYQEFLYPRFSQGHSGSMLQSISSVASSLTTTLLTNPEDVIRARFQVLRSKTIIDTIKLLWQEEGLWMLTKGLSARMIQNTFVTTSVVMGYEWIKRVTVKDEFKDKPR